MVDLSDFLEILGKSWVNFGELWEFDVQKSRDLFRGQIKYTIEMLFGNLIDRTITAVNNLNYRQYLISMKFYHSIDELFQKRMNLNKYMTNSFNDLQPYISQYPVNRAHLLELS